MSKISIFNKDTDSALAQQLNPIVYLPKINCPNTTVVKRAQCTDFSNDLMPRFGIERFMTQSIQEVQGETGPAGERVFKPINDVHDAVRFVGLISTDNTSSGLDVAIQASSYAEFTFYGTGLNLLLLTDAGDRSMSVSVDGGGSSTIANTGSIILNGRNYSQNGIINVSSGLTLGLHTVKVSRTAGNILLQGYEVLNTNSTLQQTAGTSYLGGKRLYNSALSTSSPTSGFTNTYGTAGTRGGHVLVYQKADGSVAKDIRYTETAAAYLTSTSHTNESLIRSYSWREFGAGRSDDFSSVTTSSTDRGFTLDDGTTTLVSKNAVISSTTAADMYTVNTDGAGFSTFTFVGTGLDISWASPNSGTNGATAWEVFVDGTSQGYWDTTNTTANVLKIKTICSGLPYGTHTVKIMRNTVSTWGLAIKSFDVYGPSKPALPAGCVELADYYVMANYATGGAGLDTVANGVLRKQNIREFVYSGTFIALSVAPTLETSGFEMQTQTNGGYIEYIFWGSGFEFRNRANTTYSGTNTVSLQAISAGGSLLTLNSTNFPGLTAANIGGDTFTYSSGNLAQNASNTLGSGFSITGLTLGLYKIRLTAGTTSGTLVDCLDIITPIHAPKGNLPGDIQNTLTVGSCALSDNRKFSATSVKTLANWAQAVGVASGGTTTSTTLVPMIDASLTIRTAGNPVQITYNCSLYNANITSVVGTQIYVDGIAVGTIKQFNEPVAGYIMNLSDLMIVPLAAGTHKIDLYWNVSGGTGTLSGQSRSLTVTEL